MRASSDTTDKALLAVQIVVAVRTAGAVALAAASERIDSHIVASVGIPSHQHRVVSTWAADTSPVDRNKEPEQAEAHGSVLEASSTVIAFFDTDE